MVVISYGNKQNKWMFYISVNNYSMQTIGSWRIAEILIMGMSSIDINLLFMNIHYSIDKMAVAADISFCVLIPIVNKTNQNAL